MQPPKQFKMFTPGLIQILLLVSTSAVLDDLLQPPPFSFMVSIRAQGTHICAGAILNPRLVLTSAHCVRHRESIDSRRGMYIVSGTTNSQVDYFSLRLVEDIVIPKQFDNNTHPLGEADFALLIVNPPFRFSRKIDWIGTGSISSEHARLTVVGWQPEAEYYGASISLKAIPMVTKKKKGICVEDDTHIWAVAPGVGTCLTDPGAVLIDDHDYRDKRVVGVSSAKGLSCKGGVKVFTRLDAYKDIIDYAVKNSQ